MHRNISLHCNIILHKKGYLLMKQNQAFASSQEYFLEDIMENADFGMMIATETNIVLYENKKFSTALKTSSKNFLQNYPTEKTDFPLIINGKSVTMLQLFYKTLPCYCFFVLRDFEKVKVMQENFILRKILEHVDNGVVFSDSNGYITLYNHAHALLDGFEQKDVLGKHLSQIYFFEHHTGVVKSKKPLEMYYHQYRTVRGDVIPITAQTSPVIDPDSGEVLGVYSIERDISQIQELQQKLARLEKEVTHSSFKNNTSFTFDDIVGESTALLQAVDTAKMYAKSESPILIYGETGTGKELFAQSIHNYSPRFQEPFIAINCGAVPENLIESTLFGSVKGAFTGAENHNGLFLTAKSGTLFLDEVNSMSLPMQTKLLRVLQEKKVRPVGSEKEFPIHCCIISSCNMLPEDALKQKVLRSDLYFRLGIIRIDVPSLRERQGDAGLLTQFFAERQAIFHRKKFNGFSEDFLQFVSIYSWPGNVRELEFTIESCITMLDDKETIITLNHLPVNLRHKFTRQTSFNKSFDASNLPQILAEYEKNLILHTLEKTNGNITQAANFLGIQRQNLQHRMKKLEIKKE